MPLWIDRSAFGAPCNCAACRESDRAVDEARAARHALAEAQSRVQQAQLAAMSAGAKVDRVHHLGRRKWRKRP